MDTLWEKIADALEDKKATDLVVYDIKDISSFADNVIICTGMSDRQIKAMAQYVIKTVGKPAGAEGLELGRWVLLDYMNVVVHIFQDDIRRYYDIESMWSRAPRLR